MKKLDVLARALVDRPGLKLDVAGRVDPVADREGLKRAALDEALRTQQRKRQDRGREDRGRGEATASAEVAIGAAEYPALVKAAYDDARLPKPSNALPLPQDLSLAEMERLLLAQIDVDDEALRQLAVRRAQAAKGYLVGPGKVPPERVFLTAPKLEASERADGVRPTRVEFTLK
jgi:hypothetical protein